MIYPLTSLRFFFALIVFLSHYSRKGEAIFAEGDIGVEFLYTERFYNKLYLQE